MEADRQSDVIARDLGLGDKMTPPPTLPAKRTSKATTELCSTSTTRRYLYDRYNKKATGNELANELLVVVRDRRLVLLLRDRWEAPPMTHHPKGKSKQVELGSESKVKLRTRTRTRRSSSNEVALSSVNTKKEQTNKVGRQQVRRSAMMHPGSASTALPRRASKNNPQLHINQLAYSNSIKSRVLFGLSRAAPNQQKSYCNSKTIAARNESTNNKFKFLASAMMPPTIVAILSLLLVASTWVPSVVGGSPNSPRHPVDEESRQYSDLLKVMPPYAPSRRPPHSATPRMLYSADEQLQPPQKTTTYIDHDRSTTMVMPDVHQSGGVMTSATYPPSQPPIAQLQQPPSQQQDTHQQQTPSAASSNSHSKFARTNELDGFLDDMNHRELQTVAAGRPIEDLFQPKPYVGHLISVASHNRQAAGEPSQSPPQGQAAPSHEQQTRRSVGPAGLMGSHSEQPQIYSDCALILQRTYVKNIEDPKQQLVPFGKTEQACISYKHIDKAIEQAKHKLKFREFAKMRRKPAQTGPHEHMANGGRPPPPFEVIHSSLEPPEDLVAAIGEINMAATQIIADQFDLSNDELLNGLPLIDMSKTKFWNICPLLVKQDLKCELSRFRTFTAHCNNLKHPTWGAAKTPYARYLPPVHPDGIWVPRKSVVSEITFDLGVGHRETLANIGPSMPMPTIRSEDESHGRHHFPPTSSNLQPASEGESMADIMHHRFGMVPPPPPMTNSLDDAVLSSQADAELMRETHDDGDHSHMDMAGSVHFVRRARVEGSPPLELANYHEGPSNPNQPQPLMHHHHRMISITAAAAQAHHHHMAPPPPPPHHHLHYHHHVHHQPAGSTPIVNHHQSHSIPQELPSARLVSSMVHRDVDVQNHDFTMLFMSWGQLLDHDMTRSATPPNTIKCCPSANGEPPSKHKLCLPISVPPNDPFYSKFNVQCLEFRRTLAGVRPNCVLGPRVHQNANTSPIDANFVYGSSQETADALRLFKGGRLRDRDWFRNEGLKPLLPAQEIEPDLNCLGRPKDLFCFLAGDVRVNEQTHLTVLHTLYMREHNRIADKLSELNPHWDDERTFQETRHLVAAGVQHVLINEYIPQLIGRKMTELYNLTVSTPSAEAMHHHRQQQAGYWHGYDPTVTTSVSNSFAAAAFRQGHTFVQSTIDRFNKFHEFVSSEKLRNLFMQPFLLYQPGVMDELVGGMINAQSQSYDPFMTEELAGHLFQPPEQEFGHDLASINLQRGRDQGLPGYNLFREWCGLPRAETFEQLEPYLTNRTAFLYSKLYKHVDDIDLWSAGISERKLPGAAIGPTFSCILSRQFSNTRRGDRFWYENPGLPSSFTPDQLHEIKKLTLAKLLCTNADDLPTIQRWAFRQAHPVLNPRVECSQLPEIDLQYWQEE